MAETSLVCLVNLVDLVCFVYLVHLVYPVSLVQPNKQDKPNKPNKQAPLGFLPEEERAVEPCNGDGDEFNRQQQPAHNGVQCGGR